MIKRRGSIRKSLAFKDRAAVTHDHNNDTNSMRFYATSEISDNRKLTPEGFLLCLKVPLARTGTMLYGGDEVPIDADSAGLVRISREEDEVFRSETMASFVGKPITDDHPADFVTPENWKEHAVGTVIHVYRGEGIENDLMFGDILITDKSAIEAVEEGKVEVSCGYDAEYEQIDIGRGRQFNIIGNHVALVDNGRCGKRCSIGDKQGVPNMPKATVKDLIKNAFKTRNAIALDKALATLDDDEFIGNGEGEERSQHIHVHVVGAGEQQKATAGEQERVVADSEPMTRGDFKKSMDDYFKSKDEAAAAEKKKAEDAELEEKKRKEEESTDDAEDPDAAEEEKEKEKRTGDAMKIIKSRAEILSPGFKVPTADCKCKDRKVKDQLLDIKRRVLGESYRSTDGKKAITPFLLGKEAIFDKLSAAIIESAFIGASEIMRSANNSKTSHGSNTNDNSSQTVDAFSKGGLNKINTAFWNQKKGA